MPKSEQRITTKEFSQKAGVSTATVTAWIKKGKIKGKKEGAKWMIDIRELKKVSAAEPANAKPVQKKKKAVAKSTKQSPSTPKAKMVSSGGKPFSVEAFAEMTYLTIYGVEKWLKEGRLSGGADASGQRRIDAANLDRPHVKRLLR